MLNSKDGVIIIISQQDSHEIYAAGNASTANVPDVAYTPASSPTVCPVDSVPARSLTVGSVNSAPAHSPTVAPINTVPAHSLTVGTIDSAIESDDSCTILDATMDFPLGKIDLFN